MKSAHTILGVGVAVVRDDRVLLSQRLNSDAPGCGLWAMPGGTLEPGECPAEAAEREVREETGLTVITLDQLPGWYWTDKWAADPWLTLFFHATCGGGDPINTEPHKHGPWGWYGLYELPTPLWTPNEVVDALRFR